jgi:hypothetical protein
MVSIHKQAERRETGNDNILKAWPLGRVKEMSRFNPELPPLPVCQNYRRVNLAFRNSPIPFEKPVFLLGTDHLKTVPFIEVNGPHRSRPRTNQHGPAREPPQMG